MILRTPATKARNMRMALRAGLIRFQATAEPEPGTIYPALVRLEQHGWTRGSWSKRKTIARRSTTTITKAG